MVFACRISAVRFGRGLNLNLFVDLQEAQKLFVFNYSFFNISS